MARYLSYVTLLALVACGGETTGDITPGGGDPNGQGNASSASSSSSSSGVLPETDMPVIPVKIAAMDYDTQQGEDDTRSGDTTGPCKEGLVDLIDEGDRGCAIGYTKPGESVTYKVWAPTQGRYDFNMAASSGSVSEDPVSIDVLVNGDRKMTFQVEKNGWGNYESELNFLGAKFEQGENTVTIVFNTGKANLLWIEVKPPYSPTNPHGPAEITGNVQTGGEIWQAQCAACHTGVDTPALADAALIKNTPTIELLVTSVHASMPLGRPQACEDQCANDVSLFIAQANPFFGGDESDVVEVDKLGSYPAAVGSVTPHAVSAARLTQTQYNNTIRDIFETDITLSDDFPPDARIGLFSNDAYSLFISLSHLKAFEATAQKLVDEAFDQEPRNANVVECAIHTGEPCVRDMLSKFGKRLWRRPLTNAEVETLVGRYNTVKPKVQYNYQAFKVLVKSMLMSPNFLFRLEIDPDVNAATARPLNDYELASRLSFFLWASTPDDALLAAASAGDLQNTDKLLQQVDRMLKDPKADSLIDVFAAQWLDFPAAAEMDRDISEALKQAMVEETRQLMKHLFDSDRPIREVLTANYTFLNEDLANLYGVSGVNGRDLQLFDWGGDQTRNGVLGHASILSVSAGGSDVPAVVVRGTWVLDRILCKHPRPPSPEVVASFPTLSEDLVGRELVETHRTNPACASCHALMDPIGFGLDNFDVLGAWRDTAYGAQIDASGELPGGSSFSGPVELKQTLATSDEMPFCFTNHLASYALGRKMDADGYWRENKEPSDYPFIYNVYKQTEQSNHKFSDIVKAIVLSDAFRKRRGANLAPVGEQK